MVRRRYRDAERPGMYLELLTDSEGGGGGSFFF